MNKSLIIKVSGRSLLTHLLQLFLIIIRHLEILMKSKKNKLRKLELSPSVKDNSDLLKQIIDAPNVGIGVFKAIRDAHNEIKDFSFEYLNRRSLEAFGEISPIGTRLTDYGSDGIEQLNYFKEVIETGKRNAYIRKAESGLVSGWFLFSNASLGDDQLIQVWEDITELKETEQELVRTKDAIAKKANTKYTVLFNSIDQGVAHCKLNRDEKGNVKSIIVDDVNSAWEKIMGVKPEDVLGKDISNWLPNLETSWVDFCQRVLDTQYPERYEAKVSDLGKWFEVFLLPLEDDYFIALCTDTTPRREVQSQLEKAIALRDEFIGLASHELKTPVTSLKVYAQFLEKRFEKNGDERSAQLLTKMVKQIDKLTLLIGDLLDVSKIESGKLVFREKLFSFDKLLSEVIAEVGNISNTHKITQKGSTKEKIYADRERTGQVITNLLTNAIKYSPERTRIIVTVKKTKAHITVSIQDFGIGISKDNQKKLFEIFYRVPGQNEATYPGLGIGLYVASEIVKRYKGKMWVKSDTGKGSTFYFTLPRRT